MTAHEVPQAQVARLLHDATLDARAVRDHEIRRAHAGRLGQQP
jgi:hypothetical protein